MPCAAPTNGSAVDSRCGRATASAAMARQRLARPARPHVNAIGAALAPLAPAQHEALLLHRLRRECALRQPLDRVALPLLRWAPPRDNLWSSSGSDPARVALAQINATVAHAGNSANIADTLPLPVRVRESGVPLSCRGAATRPRLLLKTSLPRISGAALETWRPRPMLVAWSAFPEKRPRTFTTRQRTADGELPPLPQDFSPTTAVLTSTLFPSVADGRDLRAQLVPIGLLDCETLEPGPRR